MTETFEVPDLVVNPWQPFSFDVLQMTVSAIDTVETVTGFVVIVGGTLVVRTGLLACDVTTDTMTASIYGSLRVLAPIIGCCPNTLVVRISRTGVTTDTMTTSMNRPLRVLAPIILRCPNFNAHALPFGVD
jgi:hypothetical protein